MYKNSAGYPDPTAGAAISNVMREYKKEQKRHFTVLKRPLVYVASRYAGDISNNVKAAAKAGRYTARCGRIPIAPHLMYPNMGYRDSNPAERELCCLFGLALLAVCSEVWCFTVAGKLSAGMKAEVEEAKRLHKPVRYIAMEEI